MSTTAPGLRAPRLTGAQLDSLEEAVEREVASVQAARPASATLGRPEAGVSWPRRAMRAVVRVWREAAEREAGLDAERDEVRRRLLSDQARLW